ncbi:MAG: YraN family protein, partial [Candidatus Paceibacterota bacterium]
MPITERTKFGNIAEKYAAEFLESRGYTILAGNYRKPWGEIDLIAQKDEILVFVEVKANSKEIAGFEPELRVNREKLKRIVRAARTYLAEKRCPDREWQIDIIAIVM